MKPSKTRVVGYRFEGDFDQPKVDRMLSEALASNVITQYVAKMYSENGVIWFNGPPGEKLRKLRDKVKGLVRCQ